MSLSATLGEDRAAPAGLSPALTFLFALACGVTVANMYYAQPLIGLIARDIKVPEAFAGIIVTTTQLGYGFGLFFLVGLGDLMENRRLVLLTTGGVVLSLAGVALSPNAGLLFTSFFLLGVTAVGTQILVPLAANLTPDAAGGRVIGNIMVGLLGGVMLARPVSSFLAAHFGWRSAFVVSMVVMLGMMVLLWRALPQRRPRPGLGYGASLLSTLSWLARSGPLRRRGIYQGALFGVFNLFWTGVPLMLHDRFGMGQDDVALFALAGAGGALAAPWAGRLADKGHTRIATGVAIVLAAAALLVSGWSAAAGALVVLAGSAILLDSAVQANQIFSQRAVYGLSIEARSRINSAYMTVVFSCGAIGSALGSLTYVSGGWWLTAGVGAAICAGLLALYATE